ncbi:hypothetical protein B0H14DRAFT_3864540 [Mycena olivaceomarginata]|nr:hypothetical protein B0H14DRAFT_3864540 [Mycena olivaceomarginata]
MNEISDPKNAADMYSMMPLVWSIARSWAAYWQTLRPNGQIRSERFNFYDPVLIFCHVQSRRTLPSAVARAKSKRRVSPRETDPLLSTVESADFPETEPTAPAPLRQLITRPVLIAVLNYAFLNLCSMSYDALLPLVYATPIGLGGLGITPYSIGLMMGLCGISNAFVQGLFGGRIIRYVGPRCIYTGCFCAVGLAYAAYPLLSFAARAGRVDGTAIAILVVQLSSSFFVYLAVAPSFASSLFALSNKKNLAGGSLVYIILVGIALVAMRVSVLLPRRLRSEAT